MKFTFEMLGEVVFQGTLECRRCTGLKADGERCGRTTCKFLPMCFQHLRKEMGLAVKTSTIPNAGLGLFTTRPFAKDSYIAPVDGQRLTKQQLDDRYRDPLDLVTAPYGILIKNNEIADGALQRWVGHFSNTRLGANGQSIHTGTNARLSIRTGNKPWLKATKEIPANSEVFTYYGSNFRVNNTYSSRTR